MVIVYLLVDSFLQFERSFLEARPCETHVHFIILYWLYCDYRTIRFLWFHIPSPAIIFCFIFCISWKQHEGWCGRGQSMEEVWWLRPMGFAYCKGWAKVCKIFDDPGMEPQMNMFSQDFWNWFMNLVFHPSCLKGVVKGRTRTDWSHFCQVCQVGWSGPHQGFQAHVERYRNSPVMHKSTLAFSWVPDFCFTLPGAKSLRHQDVCYVSGGRLNITCFSASFGRTCCDPEVCQTVTSPWSSRTAFASLSLAQPRKSKLLWHHVGRKRMCNNVIHSGH